MPKASSSLAAALGGLGSGGSSAGVAAGGGHSGGTNSSSRLSSVLSADAMLDGDASLILKKLGKKAPESKLKALAELREALTSRSPEWTAALLPHWTLVFPRLADDTSWQVREQSCVALGMLAQLLRRQLAPHLKQLVTPWLRCRFDGQNDVRRAALAAFQAAFPGEGKYRQALAFCRDELLPSLGEIVLTVPPGRTGDADVDAEAAEGFTRRTSTALQAAAHVLAEEASAAAASSGPTPSAAQVAALESVCALLGEHFLAKDALWRLAASKSAGVRSAVFSFILAVLRSAPSLAAEHVRPITTTVLDGLSDKDPAVHAALWDPLLLLLRSHANEVKASPSGKHILPRLLSLVRHGCYGAAQVVSTALLPLVALLPEEVVQPAPRGASSRLAPAAQLLPAIWEGLRSDGLPVAHFRALLKSHAEVLQLLIVAQSRGGAPQDQQAIDELLEVGLTSPLKAVLDGALPPRLSERVAIDSQCGAIVLLASSSRCTDPIDRHLATLVRCCESCCLAAATPTIHSKAANFVSSLARELARTHGLSAEARSLCEGRGLSLRRHVAGMWHRSIEDPNRTQLVLELTEAFGLSILWHALTATGNGVATASHAAPVATPVVSLYPAAADEVRLAIVVAPATSEPGLPTTCELTSISDLMSRLILPLANAVFSSEAAAVNALLWPFLTKLFNELASAARKAPAVARQLARTAWLELLGVACEAETPRLDLIARLLRSVTACDTSLMPLDTWACELLDVCAERACSLYLAPEDDPDLATTSRDEASVLAIYVIERSAGLLSGPCLTTVIGQLSRTISMVVGRRFTTTAHLERLAAAHTLTRALSNALAHTSTVSKKTAHAIANLMTALYATILGWGPAGGWLRTTRFDSSVQDSPTGMPAPLTIHPEAVDDDASETALSAESADPLQVEAAAEAANAAEDEAEVEREAIEEAATQSGCADGEVEAEARAACQRTADIWQQLAPQAWRLLTSIQTVCDEMVDGMRRLATSTIPAKLTYASRWREGTRRWAWAVHHVSPHLPEGGGPGMVGDALNASEWDTAFETGVCGSAAWRLGALSLALLRETTLETAFPASGELGPLHLPPELLVRLLVLFHSLHLRDVLPPEADDTVSGSLHLELQAFICARLLPFFRSAAERAASQNGPPPPIWEVLVRCVLPLALRTDASVVTMAACLSTCTLMRCALVALPTTSARSVAASTILASAALPASLERTQAAANGSFIRQLIRTVGAAWSAAPATVSDGLAPQQQSDLIESLAAQAIDAVRKLRPAASAASRAALARLGQSGGTDDESAELAKAARALTTLADLLPLAQGGLAFDGLHQLLEQCMKLDDARRSSTSNSEAGALLRDALCEAIGPLLAASVAKVRSGSAEDGGAGPAPLLKHFSWLLPLIEDTMQKAAASPSSSSDASSRPGVAAVRGCVGALTAVRELMVQTEDAPVGQREGAAAEAGAMAARAERMVQLVVSWLVGCAPRLSGRLGAQATLLAALQAASALSADALPAVNAVAPLGVLVGAHDARVRLHALSLFGRLPEGNASIVPSPPAKGGTSKDAGDSAEDTLSDAELNGVFSAPLLASMRTLASTAASGGPEDDDATTAGADECFGAWAVALEVHARYEPAARGRIANHWKHDLLKDGSSLDALLRALVNALPLSEIAPPAPSTGAQGVIGALQHGTVAALCTERIRADGADATAPKTEELAVCLYLQMLRQLPSIVRHWWSHHLQSRGVRKDVEKFTQAHYSPILLREEVDVIARTIGSDGETFRVRGSAATRQVAATYSCEGSALQIALQLAACHPLLAVEVECIHRIGVTEARWRLWQRQISTMLLSQNGSISDALLQWKQNVDKVFEGVEECPICYMIVHASTGHLPKLECKTCHNKFHSACLYKWFSQSQKSNCPLCQTAF